tara:strand:+ start:155 stop:718 length:564 start_codon:yes stop_codon:yes gene_type:complete
MKNSEQLVSQFEKYTTVLKKVLDPDTVDSLISDLGERLLMCPRGLTEESGGVPGGLLEFALEVASTVKKMGETRGNTKSLVKVALLHELGKVGSLDEGSDLYLIQDSDWHRDKLGHVYKYNDKCEKMNVAHRTLWLLSQYDVKLTKDEWTAINVSQGLHLLENQFYANALPPVAALLLSARMMVEHG